MSGRRSSFIMSEIDWINVASKSLAYCAQLLQQIKQLKEEVTRLKTSVEKQEKLIQDLNEKHGGYDTVY